MNKKVTTIICILVTLFGIVLPSMIQAQPSNVKDCLEDGSDCSEVSNTPNQLEVDSNESNPDVPKKSSLAFDIIKMIFALFLILLLIYLLLKFLKTRNKFVHQVKSLENLGGISVGQNKSIQMVRIGKKVYMIGVGENVEMLREITDEEVKKDLIHKEESKELQASTLLGSFFKKNKADNSGDKTNEFKNLFANELNKLKEKRTKIINQQRQKEDKNE